MAREDVHYRIPSVVIFQKRKGKQTSRNGKYSRANTDLSEIDVYKEERRGRVGRKNILHNPAVYHIFTIVGTMRLNSQHFVTS